MLKSLHQDVLKSQSLFPEAHNRQLDYPVGGANMPPYPAAATNGWLDIA